MKVWKEYCSACKKQHLMTMQNCPTCPVHETPQPVSDAVFETCNGDYSCDGCQAYRDHEH